MEAVHAPLTVQSLGFGLAGTDLTARDGLQDSAALQIDLGCWGTWGPTIEPHDSAGPYLAAREDSGRPLSTAVILARLRAQRAAQAKAYECGSTLVDAGHGSQLALARLHGTLPGLAGLTGTHYRLISSRSSRPLPSHARCANGSVNTLYKVRYGRWLSRANTLVRTAAAAGLIVVGAAACHSCLLCQHMPMQVAYDPVLPEQLLQKVILSIIFDQKCTQSPYIYLV